MIVGAPVRLKVGWRHRDAILVDLSVSGCRLVTDRPVERNKTFRLEIPSEVAAGRALSVDARVVQSHGQRRPHARAVRDLGGVRGRQARLHAQLQAVVAAHAEGPAVCEGAPRIASDAAIAAAAAIAETAETAPDPAALEPVSPSSKTSRSRHRVQ